MLYRGPVTIAILLLGIAIPFTCFGIGCLCVTANEGIGAVVFAGFWTVFSLFMSYAGFDLVYRHVLLDEEQLIRKTNLGMHWTCIRWEEIQSWLVWPSEDSTAASDSAWKRLFPEANGPIRWSLEGRGILIRLSDRRAPFFISDFEVSIPSFESFLTDVRHFVGDREIRLSADLPPPASPVEAVDAIQTSHSAAIKAPPQM
jgi:hypothetical protein